jgi:hypothetical protein
VVKNTGLEIGSVDASATSPSVHSSALKIAGDELGASNIEDVRAELESALVRVAELSGAVQSATLQKDELELEVLSLMELLQAAQLSVSLEKAGPSVLSEKNLVFDMDETIITRWLKENESTTLIKYPISFSHEGKVVNEDILIRPFAIEVLKKVSTMISNWSILFMFYLFIAKGHGV